MGWLKWRRKPGESESERDLKEEDVVTQRLKCDICGRRCVGVGGLTYHRRAVYPPGFVYTKHSE